MNENNNYRYFTIYCPAIPKEVFHKVYERLQSQVNVSPHNWKAIYESGDLNKARFAVQSFRINMLAFGLVPRPTHDPVNHVSTHSPVDFLFDFTSSEYWYITEGKPIELIKQRAELLCPLPPVLPQNGLNPAEVLSIESHKDKKLFYTFFWWRFFFLRKEAPICLI